MANPEPATREPERATRAAARISSASAGRWSSSLRGGRHRTPHHGGQPESESPAWRPTQKHPLVKARWYVLGLEVLRLKSPLSNFQTPHFALRGVRGAEIYGLRKRKCALFVVCCLVVGSDKGGAELPLPALRRQAPRWASRARGWVGGPRARSRTPPTSAPFAKKVGSKT
jgi:hypothetical protein